MSIRVNSLNPGVPKQLLLASEHKIFGVCWVFSPWSLHNPKESTWDLILLKLAWLRSAGFLGSGSKGKEIKLVWNWNQPWSEYRHICMFLPLMQLASVFIWESGKTWRMTNIPLQHLFLASLKGGNSHPQVSGNRTWVGEPGLWVFLSSLSKVDPILSVSAPTLDYW